MYMPPPPHGLPLVTIVLDLGNSCKCYGCRKKTIRVLNKLPGVREHCYNLETNQIKLVGTVDPDYVQRMVSKVKKHVMVTAVPLPPPSAPHNNAPQHGQSGPFCECGNGPPPTHRPPSHRSGQIHVSQQGHGKSASCHNPPPPPHPQPSCRNGPSHPPPCRSGHIPVSQQGQGKPASCHNPPPPPHPQPSCRNGPSHPPPRTHHLHRNELPPSSATHCPPPRHSNHNAVAQGPPHPNNPTTNQLDHFLHGPSSPLIPRNIDVLSQLAKIPLLKNVELIKKNGVRLGFQNGQVKSCHPISHMEVRPGYEHADLPHPQHPNGTCTVM